MMTGLETYQNMPKLIPTNYFYFHDQLLIRLIVLMITNNLFLDKVL